jgi:hypothetical protein
MEIRPAELLVTELIRALQQTVQKGKNPLSLEAKL